MTTATNETTTERTLTRAQSHRARRLAQAFEDPYYQAIPVYMREGIFDYVVERHESGGFLMAVFENDLVKAATSADSSNRNALQAYAALLCHCVDGRAWGSPEKVRAWLDGEDLPEAMA